jgi:coenzyme F420-reducing hydrogenase alpha subunit
MVFVGKTIDETQKMIPMLFSICGTAQACAAVRAFEQALGVQPDALSEKIRDALVDMETLREHMWRILLDWPMFYGGEADKAALAQMVTICREYQHAICAGFDVFAAGGADFEVATEALADVQSKLMQLLQQSVFAQSPSEWLAMRESQGLQAWAGQHRTIAARLIDHVIDCGWSASGCCDSTALPDIEDKLLSEAMQGPGFISQPQWQGHCCETTSLTRRDSPLLNELKASYGNGLLVRLAAHLTEVAQLAGRAVSISVPEPDGRASTAVQTKHGIGRAAAARGQLAHRVGLAPGAESEKPVISDYRILAPTEWNFHPQGIVNKALSGLKGDMDQVKQQAELLITAIDPCVAYDLVIIDETQ